MIKKYSINGGVTIEDDGYTIKANWRNKTIGVRRPWVGAMPEQVRTVVSIDEKYFYLHDFTTHFGFWLSKETWPSIKDKDDNSKTLLNKAGAYFDGGYVRDVLYFAYWKVKNKSELELIDTNEKYIQDYLHLYNTELNRDITRFNNEISFTGRTLDWIMERIGPWVEEKQSEPPPINLETISS